MKLFPINRLMEKKILSNINRIVSILIELNYTGITCKESHYNEAVYLIREILPLLMRLVDGKENLLDSLIRQLISQKLPHSAVQSSFGGLQEDLNLIISRSLNKDDSITTEPENDLCVPEKTDDASTNAAVNDEIITDKITTNDENADINKEEIFTEEILTEEKSEEESIVNDSLIMDDLTQETITAVEQHLAVPPPNETTLTDDSFTGDSTSEENIVLEIQEKTAPDNLQGIIDIIYANEIIIKGFLYRSMIFDYYLPNKKLAIVKINPLQRRHRLHDIMLKKDGISLVQITPEETENKALLYNKLQRLS